MGLATGYFAIFIALIYTRAAVPLSVPVQSMVVDSILLIDEVLFAVADINNEQRNQVHPLRVSLFFRRTFSPGKIAFEINHRSSLLVLLRRLRPQSRG